jgi:hypothetical protein
LLNIMKKTCPKWPMLEKNGLGRLGIDDKHKAGAQGLGRRSDYS